MSLKLNLGCGGQLAEGWVNIDRAFVPLTTGMRENSFVHDLRFPLPQGDGTVEMAVAHHVLDLLEFEVLDGLLREVVRVLEPGGTLRVSSVEFAAGRIAMLTHDVEWFRRHGVPEQHLGDHMAAYSWWFSCGGARRTYLSCALIVQAWFELVGLEVHHVAFEETCARPTITELDSRPEESFYVEGTKS